MDKVLIEEGTFKNSNSFYQLKVNDYGLLIGGRDELFDLREAIDRYKFHITQQRTNSFIVSGSKGIIFINSKFNKKIWFKEKQLSNVYDQILEKLTIEKKKS